MSTTPPALRRRRRLCGLTATSMLVSAMLTAGPAAADKPNVNVERVVLAAQLDPHKPGTGFTTGAKDSVLRVERVLRDKGLLAGRYVDGHFGTSTQTAWRRWENQLEVNPVNSNGLPSPREIRELVGDRYDVVASYSLRGRVTISNNRGDHVVSRRTRSMFIKAEGFGGDMTISQGSYSDGSNSAGTHLGGGVIDISGYTRNHSRAFTNAEMNQRVRALRRVGFAAWFRNWSGNRHIHAVAVNDYELSTAAHDGYCQVYEHRFGGDGLGGCDDNNDGPGRTMMWWERFKRQN